MRKDRPTCARPRQGGVLDRFALDLSAHEMPPKGKKRNNSTGKKSGATSGREQGDTKECFGDTGQYPREADGGSRTVRNLRDVAFFILMKCSSTTNDSKLYHQ